MTTAQSSMDHASAPTPSRRAEWPTWAVLVLVYAGFGALTLYYQALPWWVVLPAGTWLVAWHNSLQHEAVHGHPTGHPGADALLVALPLALWMPYEAYRQTHLRHHWVDVLTCPRDDPESFYWEEQRWHALSGPARAVLRFNHTLLGRMIIGPLFVVGSFWSTEARRLVAGDGEAWRIWAVHAAWTALLFTWVAVVCAIPVWAYIVFFAYPGLSVTLMRSYLEHRPAAAQDERTAVVENSPVMGLLFLNNNLHSAHHRWPGLAWYRLPAAYAAERDRFLADNGGYAFSGYGEVIGRFLLRAKDAPLHPGVDPPPASPAP